MAILNIQLTGVVRGAHTIQAQLIGAAKEALASSESITVYMHQAMKRKPKSRP